MTPSPDWSMVANKFFTWSAMRFIFDVPDGLLQQRLTSQKGSANHVTTAQQKKRTQANNILCPPTWHAFGNTWFDAWVLGARPCECRKRVPAPSAWKPAAHRWLPQELSRRQNFPVSAAMRSTHPCGYIMPLCQTTSEIICEKLREYLLKNGESVQMRYRNETQTSKPPLPCFQGTMRIVCCTKTELTTFLATACMRNSAALKHSGAPVKEHMAFEWRLNEMKAHETNNMKEPRNNWMTEWDNKSMKGREMTGHDMTWTVNWNDKHLNKLMNERMREVKELQEVSKLNDLNELTWAKLMRWIKSS